MRKEEAAVAGFDDDDDDDDDDEVVEEEQQQEQEQDVEAGLPMAGADGSGGGSSSSSRIGRPRRRGVVRELGVAAAAGGSNGIDGRHRHQHKHDRQQQPDSFGARDLDAVHALSARGLASSSQSQSGGGGDAAAALNGGGGRGGGGGGALSFRVAVTKDERTGQWPLYAVVRVQDRRRTEVGQGVLCLREAFARQQQQRRRRLDDSASVAMEMPVCDGGRHVGQLKLTVEVLTEVQERRRRRAELKNRVGFLASATATVRAAVAATHAAAATAATAAMRPQA